MRGAVKVVVAQFNFFFLLSFTNVLEERARRRSFKLGFTPFRLRIIHFRSSISFHLVVDKVLSFANDIFEKRPY